MHAPPPIQSAPFFPPTPARNHQVQRQNAGQTTRWRVFVVAVVVIGTLLLRHAEIDGVWKGSAQRRRPPPGGAEGGVGGTVSGDAQWIRSQRPALLGSS